MRKILRHTYSVCPVCLKRIPAVHAGYGKEVYLEKNCPEHGDFSAIIWRGLRDMEAWRGDVPPIAEGENENCPHACGLCPDHKQDTCCVLLEVTKRCNLNCSFCFAEAGSGDDLSFETIREHLRALAVPGKTLVQLSGGEPTVRDDLPQIVAAAKEAGCQYVQLNTNGIRLAEDEGFVRSLAEAGLSFVFMQFDGMHDGIYRTLRGRDLLDVKRRAIDNCARHNLGVTLVPTLVPGVNTQDIGNIIRFAVSQSPAVRGVHFQPVSYFGRIPALPSDDQRFTLDELLEAIQEQAGDLVPDDSLRPSRCDHPLCVFHGDYIVMPDQSLRPLHRTNKYRCATTTADQNRSFIARKWQRQKVEDAKEPESITDFDSFDNFLRRLRTHSFTLTAMVFQDAGNLDLERLRRCSLHVFDNGRFVPLCAYYLTCHMNDPSLEKELTAI
ncbi:MAG: radical SAM protein [Peptococcaceae bacterium MAG4]|nr:radical SAM protein [Peptococcaceae bacterium MAG4]